MGKVVVFLAYALLTDCSNVSGKVTSHARWFDSDTGGITASADSNANATATVMPRTVVSDEDSVFTDIAEVNRIQLSMDVNNNITTTAAIVNAKSRTHTNHVSDMILPVLVLAGFIGNVFTIRVMLAKNFRPLCFSVLLIALSMSDIVVIFVSTLNNSWVISLMGVDVRSFDVAGCRAFFWAYRTSKMMCSWVVVFICVERFIAVCLPLRAKNLRTKRRACVTIAISFVILGAYNAFWSWLDTAIVRGRCVAKSTFRAGYTALVGEFLLVGIGLYAVIPAVVMIVLNSFTVSSLWRNMRKVHVQSSSQNSTGQTGIRVRTTAMLLATNAAFILLAAPVSIAHVVTFYWHKDLFESHDPTIETFREMMRICEQLNYTVNFFLYVLCNKRFRDEFTRTLKCFA